MRQYTVHHIAAGVLDLSGKDTLPFLVVRRSHFFGVLERFIPSSYYTCVTLVYHKIVVFPIQGLEHVLRTLLDLQPPRDA